MFNNFKYTLLSMFTVFKHLFKQPVTLEYPEKKNVLGEHFRGLPMVNSRCIKCGTCIKVCPSDAIKIENNEFIIDLKKCIFCGNCAFYCSQKAIIMSSQYELASEDSKKLQVEYNIGGENERN